MFGIVFATLYVSPRIAVPRRATNIKFLINPVTREAIVPNAMVEVALNK
jgi:hypothetical protein